RNYRLAGCHGFLSCARTTKPSKAVWSSFITASGPRTTAARCSPIIPGSRWPPRECCHASSTAKRSRRTRAVGRRAPTQWKAAIPADQGPLDLNGQPRAPWTRQQVVYLLDVHDALMVTFLSSTAGAAIAIGELEARLRWKRALHGGQEVYPLTKLTDAPFR